MVDQEGNPVTPNEVAIRSSIRALEEMWQPWPRGRTEAYVLALGDLWPEDVEAGVLATLKDWKLRGFPPPAFVRERALAHRSGKVAGRPKPIRGPVHFHEARLPLVEGDDGYLGDAEERYVLAASERRPPQGDATPAEPWVALMWTARTIAKLKATPKPKHLPFVELARQDALDAEFRSLWQARRNAMAEGAMTSEEVNVHLMRVVAEALRPAEV